MGLHTLIYATLLSMTPSLAAVLPGEFDTRLTRIRQLVIGNDFYVAMVAMSLLRVDLVSSQEMRIDYVAARAVFTNPAGMNIVSVLSDLQNAQNCFHAADLRAAARALDSAKMRVAGLEKSTDAAARYGEAMRALDEQGDPMPMTARTLHYAAVAAYDTRRYPESISLIQRELKANLNTDIDRGHLAHTLLGLNYVALGDDANAVMELDASSRRMQGDSTLIKGPSMALASKLLPRYPAAVRAYLDQCSRAQQWRDSAKAAAWSRQIANGETPDFGRQATDISWR